MKPFVMFLYGIGGAESGYRSIRYRGLTSDEVSVHNIKETAGRIMEDGTVKSVYAIDYRKGLKRDFTESLVKGSIESYAEFKDILERDGMKIF